jgi:hypothetical protein
MTHSLHHTRLENDRLDFWVDVRLLCHGSRWLAVAFISGDPEVGFGQTSAEAIVEALHPLGEIVSASLLADYLGRD